MEGAEHGEIRSRPRVPVVDRVDEHRCAQHVGEQNELLTSTVAEPAHLGQEFDTAVPFMLGWFDFADEAV